MIARQLMKSQTGFIHSRLRDATFSTTSSICQPTGTLSLIIKKQGAGKPVGIIRKAIAITLTKLCHAISYASYTIMHRLLNIAIEEVSLLFINGCQNNNSNNGCPRRLGSRVILLRTGKDAQTDIQALAGLIAEELEK